MAFYGIVGSGIIIGLFGSVTYTVSSLVAYRVGDSYIPPTSYNVIIGVSANSSLPTSRSRLTSLILAVVALGLCGSRRHHHHNSRRVAQEEDCRLQRGY